MTGERGVSWAGARVLVTGAQGFVGGWLAERLLGLGAEVVALSRDEPAESRYRLARLDRRCTEVQADLTDHRSLLRVLNEYEVAAVFHLAAQTIVGIANRNPLSTFESNVRGTWNLLEACRLHPLTERVVVASSDKAYGRHERLPYREDDPLTPAFPYDASKAAADLIARSYHATYGVPVAVSRLANVYGGGDFAWSRLVPETARALALGRRPVLRSDGSPERDFIHVEDAVEAYLAIAAGLGREGVAGSAFNAGAGRPIPVLEIVRELIAASGHDVEPDIQGTGSPRGEIDRQWLDSTRIRDVLGWAPQTDLADGLGKTYAWYRDYVSEHTAPSAP